jgi:peroxiredoxin
MARTPSTMVPLGTPLPSFALPDAVSGQTFRHAALLGRNGLLVMFICNHCPFVIHVRDELTRIAAEYAPRGVGIVAINANSLATHPQDGPAHMKELAEELGWAFPFLFDETQEVARAFGAACTPDFFVYDASGALYYRGQLDDTRPGGPTPDGRDLRNALDRLVAGQSPPAEQLASLGCNIKWHPE